MDAEETFTSEHVVLDTTMDSGATDMDYDPIMDSEPRPPSKSRFPFWYALTVFSAIALIAVTTEADAKEASWQAQDKWVLSATVISLILSCAACIANIMVPLKFAASPAEGTLLFAELGLWVGGLAVMLDTGNGIALDDEGDIVNANLYFASWGSFVAAVVLFVDFWKEACVCNDQQEPVPRSSLWVGVGVASLVVMASASQIFANGGFVQGEIHECTSGSDNETSYCERLLFAIVLGIIGAVGSLTFCLVAARFPSDALHVAGSLMMLVLWAVGVALLTFGSQSPANGVGSLFFSCWVAFVFSLFLVSKSLQDFVNTTGGPPTRIATTGKSDTAEKEDIEPEKPTTEQDEADGSTNKETSMTKPPPLHVAVPNDV